MFVLDYIMVKRINGSILTVTFCTIYRHIRTINSNQILIYNLGNILPKLSLMTFRPHKLPNEPRHEISNNVICATSKGSDQPAHERSLIRAFASRLNIL